MNVVVEKLLKMMFFQNKNRFKLKINFFQNFYNNYPFHITRSSSASNLNKNRSKAAVLNSRVSIQVSR